jgi:GT2 family glycosyltransferase
VSAVHEPDFSVVIPTRDRPEPLQRCLAALVAQDFPRDRFEVLVVDDGGRLSPRPVVDAFRAALSLDLLVVSHGGPGRARNRAVDRARGRYLAFTDDDCRPDPGWLRGLEVALARTPDALVGGRVANALSDNPFSCASQAVTDLVYAHYNARPEAARFFASNNMAIARPAFESIGGFDDRFVILACEDRELCDRWRAAGRRMVYAPAAVVYHAHALDLRSYVGQHFTYGRGAAHFHRIRAERGSGTMREEMSFHLDLGNWLARPFRGRRLADAATTAALLLIWQAANLAGFVYERIVRTGYRRDGVA